MRQKMPNFIETDYKTDANFFRSYIKPDLWEDSNELYKEYMSWENNKFFVQVIKQFDRPLLREIKKIWNYTQVPHGVRPPTEERIVFHMGIHDTYFEEVKIGHNS